MDFFANDNDITFIKTSIANMTTRNCNWGKKEKKKRKKNSFNSHLRGKPLIA